MVHDDLVADDDASTRIQPPLVSCIALFDRLARSAKCARVATQRGVVQGERSSRTIGSFSNPAACATNPGSIDGSAFITPITHSTDAEIADASIAASTVIWPGVATI
jgi:hypothetical protein